jgi:hypothetical protein
VARGETRRLKEVYGDHMGLVVPWCDQFRVLSHSSIGGFLTHCGWNSTKEGVFCGVPFLTIPFGADQLQNSRLIVEDWKIGWRVKEDAGASSLVTREKIRGLVKNFMDLESDVNLRLLKRVHPKLTSVPSLGTFHNAKHADQARRLQKCLAILYSRLQRIIQKLASVSFLFFLKRLSFDVIFSWELKLETNKE